MPEQPEPFHAPLDIRRWARDAFGDEHALSPVQSAIGGAVLDSVWSLGVAEGRRLATEGWERKWAYLTPGDVMIPVTEVDAQDYQRWIAQQHALGQPAGVVHSRLVGPWEPAEQPAPKEADRG